MAESYKVTSQSQGNEINAAGTGFMRVWNVTYEVTSGPAKGMSGAIQVSDQDHNADTVAKMIAAKVADLTAVASLTK